MPRWPPQKRESSGWRRRCVRSSKASPKSGNSTRGARQSDAPPGRGASAGRLPIDTRSYQCYTDAHREAKGPQAIDPPPGPGGRSILPESGENSPPGEAAHLPRTKSTHILLSPATRLERRNAMRAKTWARLIPLLVVLTLLATACGGPTPEPESAVVLRVGMSGFPDSRNPGNAYLTEATDLLELVYDSLVTIDFAGAYHPQLAETWRAR